MAASGAAADFGDSGDPDRAEINDLRGPGVVDHDVVGPQILVQHFLAVKRPQTPGNLFDDAAYRFEFRLRIVDHPLGQGLPIDEFGRHIKKVALARRAGLEDMRAVDAASDPFLHHESLQIDRVVAQIDRRRLDRDKCPGFGLDRQIDVATAAGVQFPDDPVAVEQAAWLEQRRRRQVGRASRHLGGPAIGHVIEPHDLDGEIVPAALLQRLLDDEPGRPVEVAGVIADKLRCEAGADMLVNAVGRQQKNVTGLDCERLVVDFDRCVDAERSAQIALLRRDREPVILGQLLHGIVQDAVDSEVADVKQMCGRGLEHDRAQGTDIALVLVVGVLALSRL